MCNESEWEEVEVEEQEPRYCINCGEELNDCTCEHQQCDNPQCPCSWEVPW